ncbi:zinc ribbon domain-containing protein [uncultured Anaerococcus sp.]|uniref:zinc ribbon domain-containing protein n=1 Tax=uncultured Anaerococcus sp. TaxID=293428 RepID=UPI002611603D|nr:zinc ribbon domain-containing protein [uncultured Anaerococcus sp.]
MKCTNCGARVDDDARFCSVCGNKLEKSRSDSNEPLKNDDDLKSKSTYESIKNNENLIDDKAKTNKKSSDSKIHGFFNSFGKKNNPTYKASKASKNNKSNNKIDNDNNVSYPISDIANSKNKKSQDRINKNYNSEDKATSSQHFSNNSNIHNQESMKNSSSINGENNLSAQARIANKIGKSKGFNTSNVVVPGYNVNYDDIPKEYVEARIARQIMSKNHIKDVSANNEKAIKSGNICGVIRNNQRPSAYSGYDPNYHSSLNEKGASNTYTESGFDVTPEFKSTSLAVIEEDEAKSKKKFKFKPIYLLPILLIILGVIGAYFFTHRKAPEVEIDLSEYIDVAFNGQEGEATPTASLNTSKLLSDYGNEIAYKNRDRKSDEFSSPANQFINELENSTSFQYSKDSGLTNGEEITVVANVTDSSIIEDYNVLFTNTMKSVIVGNLITEEYQDPFDYIDVKFDGESPEISLEVSLKEDAPDYMADIEIAPSKTKDLSSGEEVNISLIYDEDELYNSYGIRLDPKDKTFTAPGEADDSQEDDEADSADGYITSIDSLDQDLLDDLKYNAGELIRNTFADRSFTQIQDINYLGAITGSDTSANDLKNRVMLIYEIKANEDYEGKYTNDYTYYSFVEYQNVKNEKDSEDGFYTEGPITTDNEIYHKFFVEDEYTYYEIPYYGFAFLEEAIERVNNALSGLEVDDSIAGDISNYFEKSDGVAGEYKGSDTRLSLKSDGSLKYETDQRIHQGSWEENGSDISLTIQGVNVDTPINAKFEDDSLSVSEQGEMKGQTFNKMDSF